MAKPSETKDDSAKATPEPAQRMHLPHWIAQAGLSSDLRAAMRAYCREQHLHEAKLPVAEWQKHYDAMLARPTR